MERVREKPINLVKDIALEHLPAVMRRIGVEDSEDNREDILALALNRLPQKYVTTGSGRLYAEMINNYKVQYTTDVLSSLTRAAMQVKEKPRASAADRTAKG